MDETNTKVAMNTQIYRHLLSCLQTVRTRLDILHVFICCCMCFIAPHFLAKKKRKFFFFLTSPHYIIYIHRQYTHTRIQRFQNLH